MLRLLELNAVSAAALTAAPAQQHATANHLAGIFVPERRALSPFFGVVRDPSDYIVQLCRASEP